MFFYLNNLHSWAERRWPRCDFCRWADWIRSRVTPARKRNPGTPASFHRCVSLNLLPRHWWGIWAGSGLFPKTLHPLDLDLLLNTMNLALCESGPGDLRSVQILPLLKAASWSIRSVSAFMFCFLPICLFYIIISSLAFRPLLLQSSSRLIDKLKVAHSILSAQTVAQVSSLCALISSLSLKPAFLGCVSHSRSGCFEGCCHENAFSW